MLVLRSIAAVFLFELRRSLTATRIVLWVALTLFPVLMVALAQHSGGDLPREPWALMMFLLIPMLVTMLGTFLWTAPAIAVELERKSWGYLAVRPHGRTAVLLGKYFAAVAWVLPAALIATFISMSIARTHDNPRILWAITRLALLAVPAYAAVYLVIGSLFPNRAMVVAVGYTLVFEILVSFLPALVNRLTLQYRLHSLLLLWADINVAREGPGAIQAGQILSDAPAWQLVSVTIAYTVVLLVAAILIVRYSEFSSAAESDV